MKGKQEDVKKIQRVNVREGYDLWSESYDATPNPVVAMDARHTIGLLAPKPGERILDAGCGTGRNLAPMLGARSRPVGLDFSFGMLRVARRKHGGVPLMRADLQRTFPVRPGCFDAALCALIGEHLSDLPAVFRETRAALRPGGRFIFSVYHPELAAAGKEANFAQGDTEYRLGAFRYRTEDYLQLLDDAGFRELTAHEFNGDAELAAAVPPAARYIGHPVLLVLEGRRE